MRRFSIRSAMAFIVVSAIGLAALRNANELWAGMMLLIALAAVGVAVLGALTLRGRKRHWWLGFALFSGGYLVLTLTPLTSIEFIHKLGTTQVLKYVHSQVTGSPFAHTPDLGVLIRERDELASQLARYKGRQPEAYLKVVEGNIAALDQQIFAVQGYYAVGSPILTVATPASSPSANRWKSFLPGAANFDQFQRIGHCLFTLITGFVGAAINSWFFTTRERAEAAVDPASSAARTIRTVGDRPE